jgi:TonB family protein
MRHFAAPRRKENVVRPLTLRMTRRWTVAVTASLFFHVTVAASLWNWAGPDFLTMLTPQPGRASIALSASIASTSERALAEAELTAPANDEIAGPEDMVESAPRSETVLTRLDAADPQAATLLFGPAEPVIIIQEDAATPVVMGGQAVQRVESQAAPPPIEATPATRPFARRQFRTSPEIPTIALAPSPASAPSDGVESAEPPQVIVNRAPVYPAAALAAGQTGRVIIRAEVAAAGHVLSAKIHRSSGVSLLDQAALAAVRNWRFSTAADPAAPPRPVNIPIDFVIRR